MNPKKPNQTTAAELTAKLASDPEWVRDRTEHERAVKALEAQLREEESALLADLAAVEHRVNSVWDLVNTSSPYPAAIPVLLDHLRRPYSPKTCEGLIRALTVPEARGVADVAILRELHGLGDGGDEQVRWALANALTVVAGNTSAPQLRQMVKDERFADVADRLKLALKRASRKKPLGERPR